MNSYYDILIKRLKLQPVHGKRVGPEDDQKEAANDIQALIKSIPQLNALYTTYSGIVDRLNQKHVQLSTGLGQVIDLQNNYKTSIQTLYKSMTALEQANADLSKAFGLNAKDGNDLAQAIRGLATESGIGEDKLFAYAKSLNTLSGGMLNSKRITSLYGKQLMNARQIMISNLGVTEEAADGYELMAAGMNHTGLEYLNMQQSLSEGIATKLGLKATSVQRDLTEEIGNLTADLQMQYSRIPGSLELAVLKSRALGLNMANLNSAGENLLNIESSIGQELEYQLLSGRRLLTTNKKSLTDAYRRATIEGDSSKQANLINELLVTQGDILKKNMFARKKAAELLGMDEATLARSIQKRELLVKLGAEELMNLNADDFQKEIGKLQEEIGDDPTRKKIFDELMKAADTRSTDEQALDVLNQIQTNTKLGAGVDVAAVQKTLIDELKKNGISTDSKSFKDLMESFNDTASMRALGKYKNIDLIATTVMDPLNKLAIAIPVIGEALKTTLDKLKKIATGYKAATSSDTVFMRDGLIRLHQDDKLVKVNDSTMVAATNIGGIREFAKRANGSEIDYNKLATAIASAMSNVKVEATVKTDTLFAATKLNGPTRF